MSPKGWRGRRSPIFILFCPHPGGSGDFEFTTNAVFKMCREQEGLLFVFRGDLLFNTYYLAWTWLSVVIRFSRSKRETWMKRRTRSTMISPRPPRGTIHPEPERPAQLNGVVSRRSRVKRVSWPRKMLRPSVGRG